MAAFVRQIPVMTRIQVVATTGPCAAGSPGALGRLLAFPIGTDVDEAHKVYVVDTDNQQAQMPWHSRSEGYSQNS